VNNVLVMGPWVHGGWNRTKGDRLGDISFGAETSKEYRERMEVPFFEYYLKGEGSVDLAEANVFETGRNRWRRFDRWPPEGQERALYLTAGSLSESAPRAGSAEAEITEYVSDPDRPVPSCVDISVRTPKRYMVADQRYAERRPDVATFRGAVLDEPVTMAGRIEADLWVSTSGTASDWVVKVIDEFPSDAEDIDDLPRGVHLGGYQMMVRSEVLRGRYRESYEHPKPFTANEPTRVRVVMQDVLHTFLPGHRIMMQVQSTWFPLMDRNPQKYVANIFEASEADFIKTTQRVYHSKAHPSRIEFVSLSLGD